MQEISLTQTQAAELAALAHLIDKKSPIPKLIGAALEIVNGELIALTSDRYTIAEFRTKIDGELDKIILPLDALLFIGTAAKSGSVLIRYNNIAANGGATITARNGAQLAAELITLDGYPIDKLNEMIDKARNAETTTDAHPIAARHYERMVKTAKVFDKDALLIAKPTANPSGARLAAPVLFDLFRQYGTPGTSALSVLVQPNRKLDN